MPFGKILGGIARVAVPILKAVAGGNPLLGIATSFLRGGGIGNALTSLVQRISSSFLRGGNLNIAKNPPLGPFGQATSFIDRAAKSLGDFAQRLQQFSQRLQNISSALTKFNEALKILMDAITGRAAVEDKVQQAQVSSPSTGQPAATGPPAADTPSTAVMPRVNSSEFGLPEKPQMPGPNASDEERLRYQQKMQEYQFALQQALNAITQAGAAKSNLQKAMNDAVMQALNNLR
ncbi:MAG: hypothetical protein ACUVR8_12970 [Acidobacteriota bacterium]